MERQMYLIIDGPNEHRLSETTPEKPSDYRQYAGPYAGMVPFSKVFARPSVGGDRVAEICSDYIAGGA